MAIKIFKKFKNLIVATSKKEDGNLKEDLKKRKKFLEKFEILPKNLITLKQIHSDKIILIEEPKTKSKIGDGLITKKRNVALGVFSADCLPIFLFDPKKKIIGILHAGWKGSFKEISKKAIFIFKKLGSAPKDILVYIGPSICKNCYFVNEKRAKIFSKKFPEFAKKVIIKKRKKYYLDLRLLNKLILMKLGVLPKHIQISKICTFSRKNYFSFRREKTKLKGENLSLICLK